MSTEENKKKVSAFFAHFKRKDVAGAMAMMSADGTWWIGGKTELFSLAGLKSKEEMTAILMEMVPGTEDGLEIRPLSMIAEGDSVACEAESYGVLANGRVYNNQYHFLVTFRDGEITQVKEYLDTMHTADVLKG